MLSLDLLDKVAKRLDFHSTASILLDFFDKDQISLNITRLHSTHSTRWPNGSIFSSIFCRVKNRVKNRFVWPGPKIEFLGATINLIPYCKFSILQIFHFPYSILQKYCKFDPTLDANCKIFQISPGLATTHTVTYNA